ncbi:hydrophobin family protein [Aspergillus undulatus]|uniref:hydrophobin family protein n=1 Tax=Aspergillus undulatus TaxID=1810928 RepID=UPI003CCCFB42
MKFLALATLVATALAMPQPGPPRIEQNPALTQNSCAKAQLSCCDTIEKKTEITQEEEEGLLSLLNGGSSIANGLLGKYSGCSALLSSVNGLIGADGKGLVGGQCNNHVACCNTGPGGDQDGLANVAIPCIPVQVA